MTQTTSYQPPARQGFYLAQLENGSWQVAEWRQYDKKVGKAWYIHVGETPTSEKKPQQLAYVRSYKPATKEQVNAALKRELTLQETVQAAYDAKLRARDDDPLDPPPDSRQLEIGDKVIIGALEDCKVEGLFDEGRFVVVSSRSRPSRNAPPSESTLPAREFMCTAWTEVLKKRDDWASPLARDPVMFGGYSNSEVRSLLFMCGKGLNYNAEYQRGYAWTEEDQQRYLASVFEGRELGRFIFVRKKYPHIDEVLDGKQRLNCLWQFYTSRIAYQGVYWHELHPADRMKFGARSVQWATLPGERYTRADLLRIFLEVNATGVPQTEEHLEKVRALLAEEERNTASTT